MPAIASTTAPTTSPSSATWLSISFARSRQRAPCASRSSGRDGRTHSSPKSSLKFERRLPCSFRGKTQWLVCLEHRGSPTSCVLAPKADRTVSGGRRCPLVEPPRWGLVQVPEDHLADLAARSPPLAARDAVVA